MVPALSISWSLIIKETLRFSFSMTSKLYFLIQIGFFELNVHSVGDSLDKPTAAFLGVNFERTQ